MNTLTRSLAVAGPVDDADFCWTYALHTSTLSSHSHGNPLFWYLMGPDLSHLVPVTKNLVMGSTSIYTSQCNYLFFILKTFYFRIIKEIEIHVSKYRKHKEEMLSWLKSLITF